MDQLNSEGKRIGEYLPKIESEERDLELMDVSSNDEELEPLPGNIKALVDKTKGELQKRQSAKKEQEKETK